VYVLFELLGISILDLEIWRK